MRSGWLRGSIYWVLLVLGSVCCYKTIIPDSWGHPLASSRAVPKALLRWIRVNDKVKTVSAGMYMPRALTYGQAGDAPHLPYDIDAAFQAFSSDDID